MFFIFGWNHPQVTEYGPVQQEECKNCHNKDLWQLKKISRYFTLFFIPIFPHDNQKVYHCPICNYGITPDAEDFESYKAIAQANTDCLEKKITEDERLRKLEEIYSAMKLRKQASEAKDTEDSKKWAELVGDKTNEELQLILNRDSAEYSSAFIIAAKKELERRMRNN